MKKLLSLLLALALALSLVACGPAQEADTSTTRTVTDCSGRTVEVPKDPQSICCADPFAGAIIVMLGYGDRITTTCNNVARSNLLCYMCPSLSEADVVKSSGNLNAEAILEKATDLIVVAAGEQTSDALDAIGVPYVATTYETLDQQFEAILMLGRTLGAEEKAQEYVDWCKAQYKEIETACGQYTGEPIKLYHSVNEALRTDYEGSICAEWIAKTNVVNVSLQEGVLDFQKEGKAYTTLEQIYEWNPDLIICNESGVDETILRLKTWQGMQCVADGKVYQMPVGISRMGHPTSTETVLACMWLANLVHPELYDIDFKAELKNYYKTFYDFELDDEMVQAIIDGKEMRAEKSSTKVE